MTGPERTIDKIDKDISHFQDVLSSSSSPRSSHDHPGILSILAELRLDRFSLSDDEQDLEISILQFTHAIFLPFPPSAEDDQNILSILFHLSLALFHRSRKYKQPNDIRYSIKFLHFVRDVSSKVFGAAHADFTTSLVHMLALQMQLEPANAAAMEWVEEMSTLCRELLSSDPSELCLTSAIETFSEAVLIGLIHHLNQPPQKIIECLREANMRLPNSHIVPFVLFRSFDLCFYNTKSNADYENAMTFLDKMLALHSPTDNPSPYLGEALRKAAGLVDDRFKYYGNPEYLEEAISRYRTILGSTSLEDPHRDDIIQSLADLERSRFEEFGVKNSLPEVHSGDPGVDSDSVIDIPSFSSLAASLTDLKATNSPLMTVEELFPHFEALGDSDMDRITDTADIEEAVKYCRLLLTSLRQRGDETISMTHWTFSLLGNFFCHAYDQTNNSVYLNEAIEVFQGILEVSRAQWLHFSVIRQLILSLFDRRKLSNDKKDFDEIMRLFPIASTDTFAKVPDRFENCCEWAQFARKSRHSSAPTAYESAISLMQDTLTFAPTLEIQHFRLVAIRNHVERLPLDYASYLVHMGQLEEAIVTLERGRGLLWSELRGLRTSIDQLKRADLRLAEKFAAINKELEELTTSDLETFGSNDTNTSGGEAMDPFGVTVVKQRKLLDERTSFITQIRSKPGFENFLMAPSFESLRSAAACGPVIIINHCRWRSDIIILLSNSPPSLITTQDDFYNRAKGLKEQLLAAQGKGLDSKAYETALTSVLENLYDLVGRPVIQRLQELNIPEQSRIWWCPTSVFCSLPLHAMGPVRFEGRFKLYFFDLYIPSYTPTLSALIESRKGGQNLSEKPSILLVAQPDEFMPAARAEISLVRHLETTVTTLCSVRAIPSNVMEHLPGHRFAHFSCHGILGETGKPFDACFKLFQGLPLTLLEIIRSQLRSAEFAFLSACHTAELTKESIADEGLHLSAAVQYSGFRSVVGTMWAMADIDGQVIAKHFYGSVFSDTWKGVPYYERTAEALRDAVKELRRKKKVTLERWVNFVHYGA